MIESFKNQVYLSTYITGFLSFLLQFFTKYGPSFELAVEPNNRKNHNSPEDLQEIIKIIEGENI